mmetsp:Transcript_53102/g.95253  ORF Transcript_53102/g.95253 Transcript_53102/m.95253 type:complete len:933 (-) Transcript_53102:94-2892(-)|eukprot:CAMPEP_0197636498 /NCGR_PEP_ID=MMETSP1338-20131121/11984_1 /TAXON_ID=43686 ORGANISM="Pelagodinium beii, Strain RCC1491" /NCGR_SAMPLE_ID=MMETSP1338 /ASSEMBLY_ACC=CAM_ASM_000754 /LENGTH=932 /DNA_ID=CAMNT_0043208735 /DNA_START=79 /DNA_END=2877 /DNA_ORIENTATION=-
MRGSLTPWASGRLPQSIPNVSQRGISLHQIEELSDFVKRLCKTGILRCQSQTEQSPKELFLHEDSKMDWMHWEDIKMEELAEMILKPAIRYVASETGSQLEPLWSWIEIVATGPQEPKFFVSFTMQSAFRDFVGTVDHLAEEQGMTIRDSMWISMFALENHHLLSLSKNLLESPIFSTLARSEATALFLDKNASILERSWCIFDMAIFTDTARSRRRWKLRAEIGEKEKCSIFDVEEEKVDQLERERYVRFAPADNIDIFLQSNDCRLDWQVRSELAQGEDIFTVSWDKVREQIQLMKQGGGIDDKPLLLCTPDGLVGTRRATSVPVLHALLESFCCSMSETEDDVDRRLIMNYIAQCYCEDERSDKNLLDGIRSTPECMELDGTETVQDETVPRRLDGSSEYRHEHQLVTGEKTSMKFKMLDHSIRQECIKALEAGGVKVDFSGWKTTSNLKRVCNVMPPEHRALTLSQLRILANSLRQRFVEHGGLPAWHRASSRDLWNEDKEQHVLLDILPANTSFSECFQTARQSPDTYVICPEDVKLEALFHAIERHAEARLLPEKTTYYVDALCRRQGELAKSPQESAEKTQRLVNQTGKGVLLILDRPTSVTWRSSIASLWCLYELFFADRNALLWDVACGEGIVAMRAPLATKRWIAGKFDSQIAWNLSRVKVKVENARCTVPAEQEILVEELKQFGKMCISDFERKMSSLVPSRMLGPVLRQAACLRDEADFRLLRDACDIMAGLRCKGAHLNLSTLEGAFGETALHVAAAAAVDGNSFCSRGVEMLVRLGMDVNAPDDAGETPLHWAAMAGRSWATGFLLRNGSDPLLANYSGLRPFEVCCAGPAEFLGVDSSKVYDILKAWTRATVTAGREAFSSSEGEDDEYMSVTDNSPTTPAMAKLLTPSQDYRLTQDASPSTSPVRRGSRRSPVNLG